MNTLKSEYGAFTIQHLTLLYQQGQLNLEPGFQRNSVWNLADRRKLIESLLQSYPVPSIFLYRQSQNGALCYDVIDGKQRIETILKFQGVKRGERFSIKWKASESDQLEDWDWKRLQQRRLAERLQGYKFQTVEISGDLSDIIDLFVRINSTGKRLTGAEQRHARYYRSAFLKQAATLARRRRDFFLTNRLLSTAQLTRMKHVELICELMVSVQKHGLIDKKKALDAVIGGDSGTAAAALKASREVARVLTIVKKMFPDFGATRFRNAADFYSLFMLVWKLDAEGAVLSDPKRNRQADDLLCRLDHGVAKLRESLRNAESVAHQEPAYRNYLLAVNSDTDSFAQRQRRQKILEGLLAGIFESKDARRIFSLEQRRILWHSDSKKACTGCGKALTWNNFTVDHTKAHALGGKTHLRNASLMCQPCNSRWGKRPKAGR